MGRNVYFFRTKTRSEFSNELVAFLVSYKLKVYDVLGIYSNFLFFEKINPISRKMLVKILKFTFLFFQLNAYNSKGPVTQKALKRLVAVYSSLRLLYNYESEFQKLWKLNSRPKLLKNQSTFVLQSVLVGLQSKGLFRS